MRNDVMDSLTTNDKAICDIKVQNSSRGVKGTLVKYHCIRLQFFAIDNDSPFGEQISQMEDTHSPN